MALACGRGVHRLGPWPPQGGVSTTSPHVCWQYLELGPGAVVRPAAHGIRMICDAYRLDGRDEIVDVIMWWQDRCWQWHPGRGRGRLTRPWVPLRDDGAVREVRASFEWVAAHRSELEVS